MSCVVSFIVPCLNSELTITQCIDSIQRQTTDLPFEIIVVDNGSTDNTSQLAQRERVRLLNCDIRGAGSARNVGAKNANGAFLAFVDSDVVLAPDWLAILMARLLKENFAIALGRVIPAGENSFFNRYREALNFSRYRGTNISLVHPVKGLAPTVNTAACIYRKNIFVAMEGFNEGLTRLEDSDLSMRVFYHGGAIFASSAAKAWVYNTNGVLSYLRRSYRLGRAHREFCHALKLPVATAWSNYKLGLMDMSRNFPEPGLRLFHYLNLLLSMTGFCMTAFRPPIKAFTLKANLALKTIQGFSFELGQQNWQLVHSTRLIFMNETWHFLDTNKVVWHTIENEASSDAEGLMLLSKNMIIESNRG